VSSGARRSAATEMLFKLTKLDTAFEFTKGSPDMETKLHTEKERHNWPKKQDIL
jgi:hypothetical protein